MRRSMTVVLCLMLAVASAGGAAEAPPMTPAAAKVVDLADGMAKRVAREGLDKTLRTSSVADWTRPGAGLDIFAFETNGTLRAHPNAGMVGHDITPTKSVDGQAFITEIIAALTEPGATTWITYTRWDPKEKRVRPKRTYARRVGLMILACGFYLDEV